MKAGTGNGLPEFAAARPEIHLQDAVRLVAQRSDVEIGSIRAPGDGSDALARQKQLGLPAAHY
jgi:hypothetical protein